MKKRIIGLFTAAAVLGSAAVSCSSEKKEITSADEVKAANEYRFEKIELGDGLGEIEGYSVFDDEHILLTSCYDDENGSLTAYIIDNDLQDHKEIEITGLMNDPVYYEIAGSGDGDIWALIVERTASEDEEETESSEYRLYKIDGDGSIVSEIRLDMEQYEDDIYYHLSDMKIWGDNFVFSKISGGGMRYIVFDRSGNAVGELDYKLESYMQSLSVLGSGELVALGQKGVNSILSFYDKESLRVSDTVIPEELIRKDVSEILRGSGDDKLCLVSDDAVYFFGNDMKLKNTIDISKIGDLSVNIVLTQENGDIILCGSHRSENYVPAFYRVTKLSSSEIEELKIINIASFGGKSRLSDEIRRFEKTHDDYRFNIIDYRELITEDGNQIYGIDDLRFKQDIISGKQIDMVYSNDRTVIRTLAGKGLYADLYGFMDKDSTLDRDSVLGNILKACEVNGKLVSIAPEFYITTVAAKKKWADKENWSIDDAAAVYENMPDGMTFLPRDSREEIVELLLHAAFGSIDADKGECDFKDPEFRKFMELADKFQPVNYDEDIYFEEDESENKYLSDKILLSTMQLTDFRTYLEDKTEIFGLDDICFVGFITQNEKGGSLSFPVNLGIMENSGYKDECWEFIKFMFREHETEELVSRSNFPSLKADFNRLAEESMKVPTRENEDGETEEAPLTVNINGTEVEIPPFTEEEKNDYVSYVTSIDQDDSSIPAKVIDIIAEEMMLWVYGESSTDHFIDMLQNRVSLLLSEQS